jgi:molecular chaperone DnaK
MKIGIDFGTSFSSPAAINFGHQEILLPKNAYGIPSVFYYDSEVGVVVGENALTNAVYGPNNIMRDIKMEILTDIDSFTADGRIFTKKEIVGYIFKEVVDQAVEQMAQRDFVSQTIDGAVISVPAAFTFRELNFIREAAEIPKSDKGAGLKVLGFIREPVAAAISYFNAPNAKQIEDLKTILVYDLGGGTCDIALVRSDKSSDAWYNVLDSEMLRIGGRQWDEVIVSLIKQKLSQKFGLSFEDSYLFEEIRKKAVEAKHALSKLDRTRIVVIYNGQSYSCLITADEFEKMSYSLLKSTMDMVNNVITKNKVQIDYIVCVGGSSNMPQIKNAFSANYPNIPLKLYEPERAIAFGCAIYAEHMEENTFLHDISKFSYGCRLIDSYKRYNDPNRLIIVNAIFKGDTLPASGRIEGAKILGSPETKYEIFESEISDKTYDPSLGVFIGEVVLSGVPDGKEGDESETLIHIDKSGLLHATTLDRRSGISATTKIQLTDF